MAENARTEVISFRVTPTELAHIVAAGAALAAPRARSDFARACTLMAARQQVPAPSRPIRHPARRKPTADVQALTKILAALGKLGSNVNQMARVANIHGAFPTEAALRGIADEVLSIRNSVTAALTGDAANGD